MNFLKNDKARQWIYGIGAAVLAALGVYGFVSAEEQASLQGILLAVLNIGGGAALVVANRNVHPEKNSTSVNVDE